MGLIVNEHNVETISVLLERRVDLQKKFQKVLMKMRSQFPPTGREEFYF